LQAGKEGSIPQGLPSKENKMSDIKGYRNLTDEEIGLINLIKSEGEVISLLVDKIRGTSDVDQRWISIGVTQLQQGLMALTRAVARPTNF